MTLLVVMACNVLFIFLFAFWKATVFQTSPLVVFLIYGLIYPSIHVAALWTILGPGKMVYRQVIGMISLLIVFGTGCLAAWLLIRQFDVASIADEVARTMGRRSRFRMTQHIETASCIEIVQEILLAIPVLFVICQIPYLIFSALSRKQLRRKNERPRENVTIRSLFFITAIMAFSFSCLSASGRNPPDRIALSLLTQSAFVCVSFVLVCWPMMISSLADHQTGERVDHIVERVIFGAMLVAVTMPLAWNYRLPRVIFASVLPLSMIALPYGLLLMQLRRLGYRLGRNAVAHDDASDT